MTSLAFLLASCSAGELGMDSTPSDTDRLPMVNGIVTDEDGEPIEHIKVTLDWGGFSLPDVVYTSSDGIFRAKARVTTDTSIEMTLTFEDIDGEENGGLFDTLTDVVTLYSKDTDDDMPVRFDLDYRLTLSTASENTPQS